MRNILNKFNNNHLFLRDCIHHSICRDQSHILYAWAKDAPPTKLPEGVAFKLAPDEFIVMQIHYANQFTEPDHTSVTVKVSSKKPKYYAGIYLLWMGYLVIPPGLEKVKGDTNCVSNIDPPLHIFAFRPHAHSLGRQIIGMKTDGVTKESKIIANGDPQKPQAFYPLDEIVTVKKGDNLFARCVFNSMEKSTTTHIGSTAGDEMCNLYLMYYNEADNSDFYTCGRNEDHKLSNIADQKMEELERMPKTIQVDDKTSKSIDFQGTMKPMKGQLFDFKANVGDICGITYDVYGNFVVLNRGNHKWDGSTFSWKNIYQGDKESPITTDTVVTINSTGHVISSWGKDFFFLPHMITVDSENNMWITDVAMHQVIL